MNRLLKTISVVASLALAFSTISDAQATTDVESWRVNSLSIAEDGTKTHRAIVNTSGDVPASVGVSLVPSDSSLGEAVDVTMTAPHRGTVLTTGSLQLLIQPEGGTATLVFLGLGEGVAVGDEFEVILPLHPEDGGDVDFVFSEGEGVISATTSPVEGEVDAYYVTISADFDITGDISGFTYFDMTVQETDGDVSVIDEQAELYVDGSDLRWRATLDTEATTAPLVDYQGTVTTSANGTDSVGAYNGVTLADSDIDDVLVTTTVSSQILSRTRAAGNYKLVSLQSVFVAYGEEVPSVSATYTDAAGEIIATIESEATRHISMFTAFGIAFEDDALGSVLTVDVDMLNADGEIIASDTVDMKVRSDWARTQGHSGTGDGYVIGSGADINADDGSVWVRLAIAGDRASEVTSVDIDITGVTGPAVVGETTQSAERQAQLVQFRGTATVETEYADTDVGYTVTLTGGDGGTIEAKDKEEKPKKKRRRRMRRAMKTTLNLPCCPPDIPY